MARSNLPSLLLLPSPPEPAAGRASLRPSAALSAAYQAPLEIALAKAKSDRRSTLIVAVAAPFLRGPSQERKQIAWPQAQALLAGLYTIITVLCEKLHIGIGIDADAGPGSVDARVVLLDHDRIEPNSTVLVDLPSFAAAYHPWNHIFYVQSEAGRHLKSLYLKSAQAHGIADDQLVGVAGGPEVSSNPEAPNKPDVSGVPLQDSHTPATTTLHRTVCLGGTFDYLHPGHKLLLTAGALLLDVPTPQPGSPRKPCEYVIGITGDELLRNKKYAEYVQPWDDRARSVIDFLASILELPADGSEEKAEIEEKDGEFTALFRSGSIAVQCVRIHDAFGPTITREDIECLVVSGETRSGGKAVNDRRAALGWPPLETYEVDVLSADEADVAAPESFDAKISSTAIRRQRAEAAAATAAATPRPSEEAKGA